MIALLLAFALAKSGASLRLQDGEQDAGIVSLCQVNGYIFDVPGVDLNGAPTRHAQPVKLPSHIVVETPKPVKAGLRAVIQNNSATTFRRPRVTFVSLGPNSAGVETSPHGVPTLRSMFKTVLAEFPEADTYTYVNSDIAVDGSFVATADAVTRALEKGELRKRFLVVGKRTNVDWNQHGAVTDASFDKEFKKGSLFGGDAEDYFMVSHKSFDWDKVPPFIVGHRGYDNWMVDNASKDPAMDVVDATQTLRAMHMTDAEIGNREGLGASADGPDYNMNLMKKGLRWGCITTDSTQYESHLGNNGDVQFVKRDQSSCR